MLNDGDDVGDKATVLLIGVGSAALVVTIYHCIAMGWCNRHQARANSQQLGRNIPEDIENPSSIENSTAQLIPTFKYQKGIGLLGGGDEEMTCAICLSEFEEGEELRSLPECMHSYHVGCIDMWLYSHSSCPVCRTDAISPQVLLRLSNVGFEGSNNAYQDLGMLQNIVIQTRTM